MKMLIALFHKLLIRMIRKNTLNLKINKEIIAIIFKEEISVIILKVIMKKIKLMIVGL